MIYFFFNKGSFSFSELTFYGDIKKQYFLAINSSIISSSFINETEPNEIISKANHYYYSIPLFLEKCDEKSILTKFGD